MDNEKPILSVKNLNVFFGKEKDHQVVFDLSFELERGETLAIVGESGSGKSVSSLNFMRLLNGAKSLSTGEVVFTDKDKSYDLLNCDTAEMENLRGNAIAMIFQEPMAALNPVQKCGKQVEEIIHIHNQHLHHTEAKNSVLALFNEVELPRVEQIYQSYPHELSGGQQQRVMIAMALANKPSLLIADEPTTALDPEVQKSIIALIKNLQQKHNIAVLFISHDLDAVKLIADSIMVMQQGRIVEKGLATDVFNKPKEAYTKGLINCKPQKNSKGKWLPTVNDYLNDVAFVPKPIVGKHIDESLEVLSIEDLGVSYTQKGFLQKKNTVVALKRLSFKLRKGETVGLVGPSGCGKSTSGKVLSGWIQPTSGQVRYYGYTAISSEHKVDKTWARKVQLIFQDPFSSLNPQLTVGDAICEPMLIHRICKNKKEASKKAKNLLEKVGLPIESFDKYPHQFSGGQRQRIVIARALAVEPEILICDESVAALDVSVQAQVLNLLQSLQIEFGLSYIFISHDHSVIDYFCDRVLQIEGGEIAREYIPTGIDKTPNELKEPSILVTPIDLKVNNTELDNVTELAELPMEIQQAEASEKIEPSIPEQEDKTIDFAPNIVEEIDVENKEFIDICEHEILGEISETNINTNSLAEVISEKEEKTTTEEVELLIEKQEVKAAKNLSDFLRKHQKNNE